MTRRALVGMLLGPLLAAVACGSLHRPGQPTSPPPTATARVSGHVSWPDCSGGACPPVDGTPVHFADAAANRTFTAVADRAGSYAIDIPPGTYAVIAGSADRSPYLRRLTVRPGDVVTLDLSITLPTGLTRA